MSTTTSEQTSALTQFQQRFADKQKRDYAVYTWHMRAHTEGGVELPYTPTESYVPLTVSKYTEVPAPTTEDPDATDYKYVVDDEASIANMAKAVKYATSRKDIVGIEKKYDDGRMSLVVTISEEPRIKVEYTIDRTTVCTKRVVGTKVVPATPEKEVEVVEWDCKPISFLAQ